MQFLFGNIDTAYGLTNNDLKLYEAEDIVSANFRFKSGIIGNGIWIFNHHESRDETVITGTEGKVSFATFDNHPVRLMTSDKTKKYEIEHPPHIQQPLIQTIVDELLGKGACPSTGKTAAHTNRVMDLILNKELP
jgi:predicted dehydrogenase